MQVQHNRTRESGGCMYSRAFFIDMYKMVMEEMRIQMERR